MKRSEFRNSLKYMSDDELYKAGRKYLLQEHIGMNHNSWKCDMIYDESQKRDRNIFLHSLKDSISTVISLENLMEGIKVISVLRIDHLANDELRMLLQTVGAASGHSILNDDEPEISDTYKIFGIKRENLFLCKVSGQSMKNASIEDGDTLIVDSGLQPENGRIIVASVNDNLFVKKFMRMDGEVWLLSENNDFNDFRITDDVNFRVLGVVKHVLHTL